MKKMKKSIVIIIGLLLIFGCANTGDSSSNNSTTINNSESETKTSTDTPTADNNNPTTPTVTPTNPSDPTPSDTPTDSSPTVTPTNTNNENVDNEVIPTKEDNRISTDEYGDINKDTSIDYSSDMEIIRSYEYYWSDYTPKKTISGEWSYQPYRFKMETNDLESHKGIYVVKSKLRYYMEDVEERGLRVIHFIGLPSKNNVREYYPVPFDVIVYFNHDTQKISYRLKYSAKEPINENGDYIQFPYKGFIYINTYMLEVSNKDFVFKFINVSSEKADEIWKTWEYDDSYDIVK